MYYILFIFLTYTEAFSWNHWFPIVSISCTDFSNPQSIELYGNEYVLWKKNNNYIFQDNFCPHRGTSLSEGYIDKKTKNLRCAYHGWEFNQKGCLTCIPQAKNTTILKNKNILKTYPTIIHSNILWAYLGNETIQKYPEEIYNLSNYDGTYVREVPYDINILLENLFDPAHIPFAHHKLQSTRDQAVPIDIIKNIDNENCLSISFYSKNSNGTMCFSTPHYYLLTNTSSNLLNNLHIFCIPVRKGTTRILLHYDFNENLPISKIFLKLPIWLRHILTNRFFDSDTMILFKQQENLKFKNSFNIPLKKYKLPTSSDKAIKIYNSWIKKNLKIPYTYKPDISYLTRKNVMSIYNQHTKNCKHCNKLYNFSKFGKEYVSFYIFSLFLITNKIYFLIFSVINYYLFDKLKKIFEYNDYIHNKID